MRHMFIHASIHRTLIVGLYQYKWQQVVMIPVEESRQIKAYEGVPSSETYCWELVNRTPTSTLRPRYFRESMDFMKELCPSLQFLPMMEMNNQGVVKNVSFDPHLFLGNVGCPFEKVGM